MRGVPPLYQIVPPPRKNTAVYQNGFVRQSFIDQQRDRVERRRTLLAALVVCVGVGLAAFALWQARVTRTVYVPIPVESAAAAAPPARVVVSAANAEGWGDARPAVAPTAPRFVAAPAMPVTHPAVPQVAMPTPVDYAARDRKIVDLKQRMEEIDETIRQVRANPHWYGIVKNSTDTSRQQASDAYLDQLDKQRNDLRRQKWALEGR